MSDRRYWSGFLAVVTDLGPGVEIPDESDRAALAAANGDLVSAPLGSATAGKALAEIWVGTMPGDLVRMHTIPFYCQSGAVVLSDANYGRVTLARIGRGYHMLRILVDDLEDATHLVFEFDRCECQVAASSPERRRKLGRHYHRRSQRLWHGYPHHAGPAIGGPHRQLPELPEAPVYPDVLDDLYAASRELLYDPDDPYDPDDLYDPEDPEDTDDPDDFRF